MEKELFTLLRLGLETRTTDEENLSDFIMMPAWKWERIGELAQKQGVLGILLDGIERLSVISYRLSLPVKLKLEWIGVALQIEKANLHQLEVMNDLAEKWTQAGCRVMVMKGQANAIMYPKPEHRNPGDIDCYLINVNDNSPRSQAEVYKLGNEIAREAGAIVDESWYKHSVISYKGETFENHQYFVHTREGKRSKLLNEELVELVRGSWMSQAAKSSDRLELIKGSKVFLPSVQWNAMFLTYHACAHFVSEGLRLKQILDWAMFLKTHQNDVDWKAFYGFCERNHLRRFADAMTMIAVKYLGVKIKCYTDITDDTEKQKVQIVTESPYAEKILHNALYEDDYVFSSGESSWKNRWHIVKNLFMYRWKYEEIYQQSVWKQLWWYANGFMFKTE